MPVTDLGMCILWDILGFEKTFFSSFQMEHMIVEK